MECNLNLKTPIIDELISECQTGDFKLHDHVFARICSFYNLSEDEVMETMCAVSKEKGEFIRLHDGWLFS